MTNTLINTSNLLNEMGLAFNSNPSLETTLSNRLNGMKAAGTNFSKDEQVLFCFKILTEFNCLMLDDVNRFLRYFDTKKTIPTPNCNLHSKVDFFDNELSFSNHPAVASFYGDDIERIGPSYQTNLRAFRENYEKGYLGEVAKNKFFTDVLKALSYDIAQHCDSETSNRF